MRIDRSRARLIGLALASALAAVSLPGCAASGDGPDDGSGTAVAAKESTGAQAAREARARHREAAGLVEAWSDEELAGQVLMVGVGGSERLAPESAALLAAIRPGAIVLFGYNISADDPTRLAALCDDIRTNASVRGLAPFVAIDHEGGRVFRFRRGLTRLPSAASLGRAGRSAASAAGAIAGSELRALGVTMNLAPVVEALDEANAAVLGDRAWSGDPRRAGELAGAFIESCQEAGVAAVAKHFPGNASVDPHEARPVLGLGGDEAEARYLGPFRAAVGSGVAAVMLSHAVAPFLDPDAPASLSAKAIGALKDGLGFGGIALTDDVQMAALGERGTPGEAAVAALRAGADLVMVSGQRAALDVKASVLSELGRDDGFRSRLADAAARQVAQKLRFGLRDEAPRVARARLEGFGALVEGNGARLRGILAE